MNQPQPVITQPEQPTNGHAPHSPAPVTVGGQFEPCAQCGAPLERRQRYCVNCAARRGDASNPASRYLAAATRRRQAAAAGAGGRRTQGSGTRVAAVGFFALLPLAVAIGVLVGRSGHSEPVQVAASQGLAADDGTGSATNVSNTSSKLLPSDFSLDKGFTVKVDLLPIESTQQADASTAESDAKSKGASDVGIINPGDFTTTPDQGQKDYVLYSGEYKQKGEAQQALGKLKKAFPDAEVIAVASASSGSGSDEIGTKVLAHTSHGTIHQVAGYKPSPEEIQHATQLVKRNANLTGQAYIKAQQDLPDIIPVGGDASNPPPLPTGRGD